MQKLLWKRKKRMFVAVFACLLLFAGWKTGKYFANATNGVSPAATVSYSPKSDYLTVSEFKFYTTSNAGKKVPASNYWIKTDQDGSGNWGGVDLSWSSGATTLYFAKSATPASTDEILAVKIPAQPVLSAVKYKPAATKTVENADGEEVEVDGDVNDKFEFYTTIKVKKDGHAEKVQIPVDPKYIQVRVNDNSTWTPFTSGVTKDVLEKMQRHGRTIYVRIAPAANASVTAVDDVKQIVDCSEKVDGEKEGRFEEDSKGNRSVAAGIVRPGISRTLKIKRKSFGPVVSIDYANHALNIKEGQAYGTTSYEGVEPKTWTVAEEAGKAFFNTDGTVTSNLIYGLKKTADTGKGTPDSLTTFFKVPKDKTLYKSVENNETYVSVTGTYDGDAVLRIQNKYAGSAVSFHYAIVDLGEKGDNAGLLEGSRFNYALALEQLDVGDLKWYLLKTNKSTGKGMAKLPAELVKGKQIIVRRAAVGKEYSSMVEVFRAPLAAGKGWYKIPQKSFTASFLTGANPTGSCACPYADITYKTAGKFNLVLSGEYSIMNDKLSVKKDGADIPFTISKKVITLTGVTGFEKGEAVEFIIKDGFLTAEEANGLTNAEYKIIVVPNPV